MLWSELHLSKPDHTINHPMLSTRFPQFFLLLGLSEIFQTSTGINNEQNESKSSLDIITNAIAPQKWHRQRFVVTTIHKNVLL